MKRPFCIVLYIPNNDFQFKAKILPLKYLYIVRHCATEVVFFTLITRFPFTTGGGAGAGGAGAGASAHC